MKNTLLSIQKQAVELLKARYQAGDEKKVAAKAGRAVFMNAFMDARRAALSRFGMRVLLAEAGLLPCDVSETADKLVAHLVNTKAGFELVEISYGSVLAASWGFKPFIDSRLSAFSVKIDDQWVGFDDPQDILREIKSVGFDDWAARGFWQSLRWLAENSEGAHIVSESEFFKAVSISDMFRVRGNLTWWSSFKETAYKGFAYHEENLRKAEEEYTLSGGCNTHYVGEAQEKWEAAGKRLEKAVEAADLLANAKVIQFLDDLCTIFELAGRPEPRADVYSPEVEREKQLASMDAAAETAQTDLARMLDSAIQKGRIAA